MQCQFPRELLVQFQSLIGRVGRLDLVIQEGREAMGLIAVSQMCG